MKRILIADDYASTRDILRIRLEMRGYFCQEVKNGAEALAAIQRRHYDLLITDHDMPVMTGLELLTRVAKMPDLQQPPTIFITGQLHDTLHQAATNAGARAVLLKPFADYELMVEVNKILCPRLVQEDISSPDYELSISPT
ncbi:MAG: Fis family transcriptional regulator [Nitrospirales bacterium]|nr:MAG: Fis family transcriptional regulator [Nitrospirales bacterium]